MAYMMERIITHGSTPTSDYPYNAAENLHGYVPTEA